MHRTLAALALALAAASSPAAVIGVLDASDGSSALNITDERGPCVGKARLAEHVPAKGERVQGCWTASPSGELLFVVFLDGDIAKVPMSALRKPQGS